MLEACFRRDQSKRGECPVRVVVIVGDHREAAEHALALTLAQAGVSQGHTRAELMAQLGCRHRARPVTKAAQPEHAAIHTYGVGRTERCRVDTKLPPARAVLLGRGAWLTKGRPASVEIHLLCQRVGAAEHEVAMGVTTIASDHLRVKARNLERAL